MGFKFIRQIVCIAIEDLVSKKYKVRVTPDGFTGANHTFDTLEEFESWAKKNDMKLSHKVSDELGASYVFFKQFDNEDYK